MKKTITDDIIQFYNNGKMTASLEERIEDGSVVFLLKGQFPGEIANDLWDELVSCIISGQGITLDLSAAEYISSSMMDVFLRIEQRMEAQGKTMMLIHVPLHIYDLFKKRGLHELLEIEVERNA